MKLRQSNLDRLDNREFDVLIVGAGINGAVAASSLTSRGAKVALIDRADFGGYTSQESSNLIWGGIKYLETFELGLVWKLCRARNQLLRAYPSFVRELRFLTTLPRGFRRSRFTLFIGTLLYWAMGRFFTRRPRLLSREAIATAEPHVRVDGTQGGVEYSDAFLVDADARFVFRFVREALDHGGICANYVESLGSTWDGAAWTTRARDVESGRELTIRSKVVINAAGPFVDELNGRSGRHTEHKHLFSKGIHLIVNRVTVERRALAFFASDGRLFFVIPLGARSCIGTTDTRVEALPPVVTDADRAFVLDNINRMLVFDRPLTTGDVIAERCGVRPLVVSTRPTKKKDTGDWTALSRKHVVEVDPERPYLSVFGGKLTDCLNVGEEVAAAVTRFGVRFSHPKHPWFGEPTAARAEFFHQAELLGLDAMTNPASTEVLSTRLWRRYGARALDLLEDIRVDPRNVEILLSGTEYTRCEIHHAARHEMVTRLDDFMRRRAKIAQVTPVGALRGTPGLIEACEILFGDEADARIEEYYATEARPDRGKAGLSAAAGGVVTLAPNEARAASS